MRSTKAIEHPILKILEHYGWSGEYNEDIEHWQPILCCFHPDQRSSAGLSLEYDAFSCLACGVKGNSITLIMREEGVSRAAAKQLAESILGGSIPEVPRAASGQHKRRRVFGEPRTDGGGDKPVSSRRRRRTFDWPQ